jgi:predicted glycogen debranching enzyme
MRPLDAAELTRPPQETQGALVRDDSDPFGSLSRREWLTVNGVGGFASGTVAGSCARRYHSLLVTTLPAPHGRMALLGKVEELVTVQGERYDLATNRYANDTVYPDGWRYIAEFNPWPVPTWMYKMPGETVLVKRVFLQRGKNTVYVTYTLREAPTHVTLNLTPLTCWKSYHAEMHPWPGFPVRRGPEVGGWYVQATPDAPALRLLARGARWTPAGWWHNNLVHERERERGLDYYEDLFCPATCTLTLRIGETAAFIATVEPTEPEDATLVLAEIVKHQEALAKAAGMTDDETRRDLVLNADQFVIRAHGVRSTVIAGYPWFTDWGRDTMIALPGLCLTTGRADVAADILKDFAGYVSQGMIPNRFPDQGETPDYNTADATLWFVHACDRYVTATKDTAFQKMMLPILEEIISAHQRGTRYSIHVDGDDGLLFAGEPGTQLTWMDAKVGDWVVTPRIGKPVEINALWINALRITAAWGGPKGGKPYADAADQATASFRAKFVRPDGRGLYDLLHLDGTPDGAIRPNQIIAAALAYSPLTEDQSRAVLEVVTQELLTPYGLRSLSPSDPAYRGRYDGSPPERDGTYHQGTVWAWLIGPLVDAYRKVHGSNADVHPLLASLEAELRDYGVGGIGEIFDGDAPHHPNGCPWQAWSVAELLRVRRPPPGRL